MNSVKNAILTLLIIFTVIPNIAHAEYKISFTSESFKINIPKSDSPVPFSGALSEATFNGLHLSSNDLFYAMDITFSPDGKNVYIVVSNPDTVFQYKLTNAWDITTASYHGRDVSSGFDSFPVALDFKNDGTQMFTAGNSYNRIAVHNLSTPWDVTTASYSTFGSIDSTIIDHPSDIQFYNNGKNILISDNTTDKIYDFSVPLEWNPNNMTLVRTSLPMNNQTPSLNGFHLLNDGVTLLTTGQSSDSVHRFKLLTKNDITSIQYQDDSLFVRSYEGNPGGVFLSNDKSKFYVTGFGDSNIIEYLIP
jgi:hypothetical protein